MEIEVPQVAVVAEDIQGEVIISLLVSTSASQYKAFLCRAEDNYQAVAKQLHDNICTAGAEGRRHKSGIIPVMELPAGLKNGGPTSARNARKG